MRRRAFVALVFFLTTAGCVAGNAPSGAGLAPSSVPSGMAGPDGAGSGAFVGEKSADLSPTPEAATGDPTAGNETPMTIVGSPLGSSTKPKKCEGVGYRLCFHDVTVTAKEADADTGGMHYELTGIVATQAPGEEPKGLDRQDVTITDLLFPLNQAVTTSPKNEVVFKAAIDASPGRALRLESRHCYHHTVLELMLPTEASSPLSIDACLSPDPTDTYNPPNPVFEGGIFEEVPLKTRR